MAQLNKDFQVAFVRFSILKLIGILFFCLVIYWSMCIIIDQLCTMLDLNLSKEQIVFIKTVSFHIILFIGSSIWYLCGVDTRLSSSIISDCSIISSTHFLITFLLIICSMALRSLIMGGGLIVWPSSLDFIKEWALDLEILYLAAIKELCTFSNISMFLGKGIMAGSLLPAIGEELFFRGVLQNILLQKTKKPFLAIIITSLFFSILHLRPYYSIMLFGLSVLFGYIYFISNNISLAIFAHFLNNSISFLTIYLFKNSVTTLDPIESFVKTLSFWHLIAGISICIFLVYTSFRKLIILQKIH